MVIIDPESLKPIQCSQCEGRNIVNPVNESSVALRCLNCGHEKKAEPSILEKEMGSGGTTTWTATSNKKPYREF